MSTRPDLEAALAKAEADWHRVNDGFDKAQANRAKANADWDKLVTDRRKTDADRRKAADDRRRAGRNWDHMFLDRRVADTDRRKADDDLALFAKAVDDRHRAYAARTKAEAEFADAQDALNTATAELKKAKAALDSLDRAQRKP